MQATGAVRRRSSTGADRPGRAELALVDDRVPAATVIDAVGEWTKASAIDLIDKQANDGGRVVVEGGDGEVEVGREPPGGAGIHLAESGAALERHQREGPTLGQVTQQQILGDVDDGGISALRRLGRRVAQNVSLRQPDVVGTAHDAG